MVGLHPAVGDETNTLAVSGSPVMNPIVLNVYGTSARASDKERNKYGLRPGTEMDNDLRICTWNLQSLNTCSKLDLRRILSDYKADITALQETRKIGTSEDKDRSKYQCDIYFSGNPRKREFGVGFAVRGKA